MNKLLSVKKDDIYFIVQNEEFHRPGRRTFFDNTNIKWDRGAQYTNFFINNEHGKYKQMTKEQLKKSRPDLALTCDKKKIPR